ncbi:hypothetical protein MC378_10575 [Polaribacter sp. MSW13]|uniref:DUF5723 domain-containing protein n=1 Tax=Polaribacter marinus TaxID=2916838 RepID=A0A9X1VNZ4_9FLAO|nr:hypothetical protein [Polaribacter marinus]MCI2229610.1 hypothetical protein [Polaribacter marinus]
MKKYIVLFSTLLFSQLLFSQSEIVPERRTQKTFAKIDYLSIDLPLNPLGLDDPNMGLTGIHYNLYINEWAYTGLGIYGAVSGNKGGFFTLGINAGIKKYLNKQFYIDTGFHFGGGGGASAPDGGGAFILPHVNLGYQFENFSINSGWSYVNFFDKGNIKGHQLNVGLEIPLDFNYADYSSSETELDINSLKKTNWNVNSKRTSLMLHVNNLKIKGKSKDTNGKKYNGETIRLAGFELANYINKNWFAFLKLDGAFSGIDAGYMDVFLGGGYHLSMNKNRTNLLAKFGIGAGGGGGVDTKGGFLIYPDISIEQKLFNNIYLSINKGFVMSPDSYFYTSSLGAGIKYYIDRNGTISEYENHTKGKIKGFEFIVKQDLYFNAKRDLNPTENLHQISLQINVDLNKNIFAVGQTSFANFGNAGAYAEGLVGLGVKTKYYFNTSTRFFAQIIGGAAGGGNISTGQGLIFKPSLGFNYKLNKQLSIRTAGGYVKAKGENLNSAFINFGINYSLSFLNLK